MFFEAGFREQHETSPRVVVAFSAQSMTGWLGQQVEFECTIEVKVEDIMPKSFRQLHRWVYVRFSVCHDGGACAETLTRISCRTWM